MRQSGFGLIIFIVGIALISVLVAGGAFYLKISHSSLGGQNFFPSPPTPTIQPSPTPTPVKYIFSNVKFTVHSPVKILVSDQDGKTAGFDYKSATYIKDIPNSAAYFMGSLSNSEGTDNVVIQTPTKGIYHIKIIATKNTPYVLIALGTDSNNKTQTESLSGTVDTDNPDFLPQYDVFFDPTPGAKTLQIGHPIAN